MEKTELGEVGSWIRHPHTSTPHTSCPATPAHTRMCVCEEAAAAHRGLHNTPRHKCANVWERAHEAAAAPYERMHADLCRTARPPLHRLSLQACTSEGQWNSFREAGTSVQEDRAAATQPAPLMGNTLSYVVFNSRLACQTTLTWC